MKRNLRFLLALIAALLIGNQVLKWIGRYLSVRPTHFVFEMPEKLPQKVANRFGAPLRITTDKVYLVGSFNQWGMGPAYPGYEMKKVIDGKWEFDLELPEGVYMYKFRFIPMNVAITMSQAPSEKGFIWIHDLKSKNNVNDGFDGFNSILNVSTNVFHYVKVAWNWFFICLSFFVASAFAIRGIMNIRIRLLWKIVGCFAVSFLITILIGGFVTVKILDTALQESQLHLAREIIMTNIYIANNLLTAIRNNPKNSLYEIFDSGKFFNGITNPSTLGCDAVFFYDQKGKIVSGWVGPWRISHENMDLTQSFWESVRNLSTSTISGISYGYFEWYENGKRKVHYDPPLPWYPGRDVSASARFRPLSNFGLGEKIYDFVRLRLRFQNFVYNNKRRMSNFIKYPFPYFWYAVPIRDLRVAIP